METIRGKASLEFDLDGFRQRCASYTRTLLDVGTGDGRYVHTLAQQHADWFMIGIDACRENLRERSRRRLPNMMFIISEAQDMPRELSGLISHISINFPWGSLLESLLTNDPALMERLTAMAGDGASIEVCLNGGALAETGMALEAGAEQIHSNLSRSGWRVKDPQRMDRSTLRRFPSTWARRLAFGRDPRAVWISGRRITGMHRTY